MAGPPLEANIAHEFLLNKGAVDREAAMRKSNVKEVGVYTHCSRDAKIEILAQI